MDQRNFYSVLNHLNTFYGIDMKDDQFENIAIHAWDQIGNKNYVTYTFHGLVKNGILELPCNADIIEAVFAQGQDVRRSTGVYNDDDYLINRYTEDYIEGERVKTEPLTASGHFEDYTRVDNTLHFKQDNIHITVIYKGVVADDIGLPFLNFKEVDAIAKYCAWVTLQKQAMMSKDKSTFEMAQMMKQQWQFAVDDARSPIRLNQNDMDNILNVQASWDRKRFGLTFKIYK